IGSEARVPALRQRLAGSSRKRRIHVRRRGGQWRRQYLGWLRGLGARSREFSISSVTVATLHLTCKQIDQASHGFTLFAHGETVIREESKRLEVLLRATHRLNHHVRARETAGGELCFRPQSAPTSVYGVAFLTTWIVESAVVMAIPGWNPATFITTAESVKPPPKSCAGRRVPSPLPSRRETLSANPSRAATSRNPSPLKSANTRDGKKGKLSAVPSKNPPLEVKVPFPLPRSTSMNGVSSTARSRLPSLLKSPIRKVDKTSVNSSQFPPLTYLSH